MPEGILSISKLHIHTCIPKDLAQSKDYHCIGDNSTRQSHTKPIVLLWLISSRIPTTVWSTKAQLVKWCYACDTAILIYPYNTICQGAKLRESDVETNQIK